MREGSTDMEQSEAKDDVLLEAASEPIGSLDDLLERCLAPLTAHIWQTCLWLDSPGLWTIGDFRYSIVEFEPAPDVTLYVQLWSEPEEPVLMEVSSGNWNPGALKYIWRNQRKALEQRGFAVGGRARNFQKEVAVSSPDDAEVVAREVLTIFFNVFGYRAEQPLTMTLHRGSRSEQRPVHTSLSPEDFMKIAEQSGFGASLVVAESNSPVVTLERGQFKAIAIFGSPIPRSNLFGTVLLRTPVRGPSAMPLPDPADDEDSIARFIVDGDGRVMAETSLRFDGGVTTEWIAKGIEHWRRAARKYQRLMQSGSKPSIRRDVSIRRRMSIH